MYTPSIAYVTGAAAIALLTAPITVPVAAAAIGFGSGGIAAGSLAAYIMSLSGGAVQAGSICAVLQSIGATATIGASAAATTTTLGGAFAATSYGFFKNRSSKKNDKKREETTELEDKVVSVVGSDLHNPNSEGVTMSRGHDDHELTAELMT